MKTLTRSRCQWFLILGMLACSPGRTSAQNDAKPAAAKEAAKDQADPVTITAFGNRLIVTSEDRAALALVSELVRLLTSDAAGPGDFQIIRLKRANAVETARLLDEAFNGAKPVGGFSGGGKGKGKGKGGQFGAAGDFGGFGGEGGGFPGQLGNMA